MNALTKRFLSTICLVAFSVCLVVAQTNTTKHTVDRGETLASIAKRYATTEEKLIELNPDAAQFVYVGMELIVPLTSSNSKNETIVVSNDETFVADSDSGDESYRLSGNYYEKKNCEYYVFAGISMNGFTGNDAKDLDMICGFHAGVSALCRFYENVFVEGSIVFATKGYKQDITASSGEYYDDEGANYDSSTAKKYMSYNVDIPILIGCNYAINDDLNLKIKVGPYMTYVISGKEKQDGYITIYPDIHSGETEYINEETKVGDMKGFKHFGCGIHAGISVNYKYLVLSASYQRGFSKVFDKAKKYEQNILLSIGYKF